MVSSISEFRIPTTETRSPTVHYEEWSTVMQIQETENGTRFNLKKTHQKLQPIALSQTCHANPRDDYIQSRADRLVNHNVLTQIKT